MMGTRVLIVDDTEFVRQMLVMLLHKISIHDTVQAGSGQEAMSILENGLIDLVLLDCIMPDMDGFQVLKAIRANPKLAKLPVILVTGHADADIVARARRPETRADGIIAKPLSLATLEGKVGSVMANRVRSP